ncbi:Olfactory receptor 5B2 [Fukomys damarensis]|uniref:Olfactory receptor 5B2 n=1 Tax=Fukomys damarensis TaxID=885580 RepID=A0A091E390_FUKDA|nr:Olfactory receptor 5B2 [Fukomys damarensis]
MENRTEVTEFILLGLTDDPHLRLPLFIIFLLIYTITMAGNLGMLLLILLDPRLHTPMYCFLVLASMAYDRYAAVCKPLHYTSTMTADVCAGLVMGCYAISILNACIQIGNTFSLSFCNSNLVHHFFCDVPPVMALSCSNKQVSELVLVYVVSFQIVFVILVISTSYIFIFGTILRMRSAVGHHKALSTCASHFTAVSIFYGTSMFMYLQPSSSHSMDTDKIASVFYTMVIPMLNPLVYSLRNKEVKNAFLKVMSTFHCWRPS